MKISFSPSLKNEGEQIFDDPILQAMADAGVFYGRKKTVTHPRMKEYVFATRNNAEILDLEKIKERLHAATEFLRSVIEGGGEVLFVGTLPASKGAVERIGKRFALPYVTNRWIGGSLTNFKVISGRIEHMKKTRREITAGGLDKYKKRERGKLLKGFERLEMLLGGLEHLAKLPAALMVVNSRAHVTAVREARRLNIPVVAVIGTSSDPEGIAYPVPANDTAKSSIEYMLSKFEEAIEEGMKRRKGGNEESATKSGSDSAVDQLANVSISEGFAEVDDKDPADAK